MASSVAWRLLSCVCIQWNPSCEATPFAPEKWHFKKGGLSSGVEINTFIYVEIYIIKGPFQRGWPLVRVASQKGFHCTVRCHVFYLQYENTVEQHYKQSLDHRARKSRVCFAWRYEIHGIIISLGTVRAQSRFRSHFKSMGDFSLLQIAVL